MVPPTYNCHAPPNCICRASVGEATAPVESDEVLLSLFVTKLSPTYPFVVVRPGISAQELEKTRPLLFSAIKMVASVRNARSMMAQGYALMKQVTERLLIRSERTLEILQTILLMLGFYHYQCMMHTQMNNLIGLAVSLASDMGLTKTPEIQERTRLLVLNPPTPKPRTNDERRALCGMWYISSVFVHLPSVAPWHGTNLSTAHLTHFRKPMLSSIRPTWTDAFVSLSCRRNTRQMRSWCRWSEFNEYSTESPNYTPGTS